MEGAPGREAECEGAVLAAAAPVRQPDAGTGGPGGGLFPVSWKGRAMTTAFEDADSLAGGPDDVPDIVHWQPTHGPRVETLTATAAAGAALGAAALGALAIGAMAVGALAIGRLVVGHARFGKLEIDELVVRKLTVLEP